jgi:hypothetical protein
MIRVVHPGSGSCFLPIPDPRVKKVPDPGSESATLVKILSSYMASLEERSDKSTNKKKSRTDR